MVFAGETGGTLVTKLLRKLTVELLARVPPWRDEERVGPMPDGARLVTEADYKAIVSHLLDGAPDGDIWVFAYGSLIWNPGFDFVEKRGAVARGWHRSFCLGWDLWFRGSPARPGLMLALDRGGSCSGVAFRLPPDAIAANLMALLRREVHILPHPFPPRWVRIETAEGPMRAITFAIDRQSGSYRGRQSPDLIADILSTAAGQSGTMAEYLFQTVNRLEEMGLHDRHLWRLQALVAERLEIMPEQS